MVSVYGNISLVFCLLVLFCIFDIGEGLVIGSAAWIYDLADSPGMWVSNITQFNLNTQYPINTIFCYGGDLEYYENAVPQFQVYYPASNSLSAQLYSQVPGVESVILVVDGTMSGKAAYRPDMALYTEDQVRLWANNTAQLYCAHDEVGGIQIDLEPFSGTYVNHTLIFMNQLSTNLMSTDFNCVNEKYPNGRVTAMFLGASAVSADVFQALGSNGFVVISGYDLSSKKDGTPSTPTIYATNLRTAVNEVVQASKDYGGKFMMGLPMSSSAHEFSVYYPSGGDPVIGWPMYSTTNDSYIGEAWKVFNETGIYNASGFLGESWWTFVAVMEVPVNSGNIFYPSTPFETPGMYQFLQNRYDGLRAPYPIASNSTSTTNNSTTSSGQNVVTTTTTTNGDQTTSSLTTLITLTGGQQTTSSSTAITPTSSTTTTSDGNQATSSTITTSSVVTTSSLSITSGNVVTTSVLSGTTSSKPTCETHFTCAGVCTNLTNDPHHCGNCQTNCTDFHKVNASVCVNSACVIQSCDYLFGDCDLSNHNGCETFLGNNYTHCGACDHKCVGKHSTKVHCKQGECVVEGCLLNWGNCDNDGSNGCEHWLGNDPLNCGGCGFQCFSGEVCKAGVCH